MFHDIGYPFEQTFGQIQTYFKDKNNTMPYVSYKRITKFIRFDKDMKHAFNVKNANELLANNISTHLNEKYGKRKKENEFAANIYNELKSKPSGSKGFMDHAYFSSIIFVKKIMPDLIDKCSSKILADCASAILLHNSMFKFYIQDEKNNKPLDIESHPLAYLLMLCDEMQCWDRVLYGRKSRREAHPYDCKFEFSENKITAYFVYENINETNNPKVNGTLRKMTETKFLDDIDKIINMKQ